MADEKSIPKARERIRDVRILEDLAAIRTDIDTLKKEYPELKNSLTHIADKISDMGERIARVEIETDNAHEKIDDFRKTIAWTIGISITACGTLVGIISFVLQYMVFR